MISTNKIDSVSAENSHTNCLATIKIKNRAKQKVLFIDAAPSKATIEMVMEFFVFFVGVLY